MKIAILSRNRQLYSTRMLAQAARKRGHRVHIVDYLRLHMNIGLTPSSRHRSRSVSRAPRGRSALRTAGPVVPDRSAVFTTGYQLSSLRLGRSATRPKF